MQPVPFIRFRGVANAAIAKGASGSVSIYYGTGGSYTDSTVDMTVFNEFADIASGKVVECEWEGDLNGVKWKFTMAEC